MILPTDLRKQLIITTLEKKKIRIEAKSEYLEYENSQKKEIILKDLIQKIFYYSLRTRRQKISLGKNHRRKSGWKSYMLRTQMVIFFVIQ